MKELKEFLHEKCDEKEKCEQGNCSSVSEKCTNPIQKHITLKDGEKKGEKKKRNPPTKITITNEECTPIYKVPMDCLLEKNLTKCDFLIHKEGTEKIFLIEIKGWGGKMAEYWEKVPAQLEASKNYLSEHLQNIYEYKYIFVPKYEEPGTSAAKKMMKRIKIILPDIKIYYHEDKVSIEELMKI